MAIPDKQFWKDLENGQEHNVIFSTKLGPGFPKHLSERWSLLTIHILLTGSHEQE